MASELQLEKGGASAEHREITPTHDGGNGIMGTTQLNDSAELLLVPAPSADPRDPLNLPRWRKIMIVSVLSMFSAVGLAMVAGFGGLLGFYIPEYTEAGATYADITALMTYPTVFMGISNFICMPLALAVGRRTIYLGSLIVLMLGGLLAAYSTDYNWHLGARMILGLAAGNSEALVPMMIQEIHFIHERSTFLTWQMAMQTVINSILCIFASPIAGAIGPGNWYIVGVGMTAACFVISIFFVPETRYRRTLAAYGQDAEGTISAEGTKYQPMTLAERPALDYETYPDRTIWSDMRLFVGKPDWSEGLYAVRNTFQVMLFPNVFWAFCLNGLTLGTNIAISTTYSQIVSAPPYNWSQNAVSYINVGQILVALLCLPLLGNASDWVIKWRARRNGGVHEPEARLFTLIFPVTIGTLSVILYGQAAAHPENFHWFAICFAFAGYVFCFYGCNIVAITLLLDSYPARSGPILVVICAFRGFISFGTSYGVVDFINSAGYDGSFGTYGALTAFLGSLGILIYIFGKRIRVYTGRFAVKERSGKPSMTH